MISSGRKTAEKKYIAQTIANTMKIADATIIFCLIITTAIDADIKPYKISTAHERLLL